MFEIEIMKTDNH